MYPFFEAIYRPLKTWFDILFFLAKYSRGPSAFNVAGRGSVAFRSLKIIYKENESTIEAIKREKKASVFFQSYFSKVYKFFSLVYD